MKQSPDELSARFAAETAERLEGSDQPFWENMRIRHGFGSAVDSIRTPAFQLGELKLPEPGPALSLDEVKLLADLLNPPDASPVDNRTILSGRIPDVGDMFSHLRQHDVTGNPLRQEAMKALLRVRPQDVPDAQLRSQIAKGFRQIAFDEPFDKGDAIRGWSYGAASTRLLF